MPAAVTGYSNPAAVTGYSNPAAVTGYSNPAAVTGYSNPAAVTGWLWQITVTAVTHRSVEQSESPEASPCIYGKLIFNRHAKPFTWGKGQTFKQVVLEQLDIQIKKERKKRT